MTHTSTELPEALRLAEMLLSGAAMIPEIDLPEAAAELRRLHAESELHQQELASYRFTVENRDARIAELESQLAAAQRGLPLPEIKDMVNSPQLLNMNDRAFWVLGWNECRDAFKHLAAQAKQGEQANG